MAPVDLFSFYIYMRDQQRSVDYLDFWYYHPTSMSKTAALKNESTLILQLGLMSHNTCLYVDITFENYDALY